MNPPRLLQTLLTVLPVLTAGLYLLGLTYSSGYLSAFGIDDSLFPLASDKVLLAGFFSLLTLTFPASIYAIAALGAFVVLVMVAAVLSSTTRVRSAVARLKDWLEHKKPTEVTSPTADDLVDKSAAIYGYTTGLVVALFLLLAMAVLSTKSGREQAEKEMLDFTAGKSSSAQVFSPELHAPFAGKLVACGDKYCAFWTATGTLIIGHEAIQKIITTKPGVGSKPASAP